MIRYIWNKIINNFIYTNRIVEIPIKSIHFGIYQPRENISEDSLKGLSQSIKRLGVIQPIIVRRLNYGYELVAGERRLQASIRAGKDKIPAIIKQLSDTEVMEIAFLENLQREALNIIDEAYVYKRLLNSDAEVKILDLAEKIGKRKEEISAEIKILDFPEKIKELIYQGKIDKKKAHLLLFLPDNLRFKVADKIIDDSISFSQTKNWIKKLLERRLNQNVDLLNIIYIIESLLQVLKEEGVDINVQEKETENGLQIKIRIYEEAKIRANLHPNLKREKIDEPKRLY